VINQSCAYVYMQSLSSIDESISHLIQYKVSCSTFCCLSTCF